MSESKLQPSRRPHIFVCTPCYGDVMHLGTAESLRKLTILCMQTGINLSFGSVSTESLIPRARNFFVACFLGHPEYTHLFFLDADITFNPESVLHMLNGDKPVVGGCYPIKQIHWNRVRDLVSKEPTISDSDLISKSLGYALNVRTHTRPDETGFPKVFQIHDGFLPVDELATGFLMIRRDVLELMRDKFPEKAYVNDMIGYDSPATKGNFYAFFDCAIHPESRRYLSEDYAFCLMCQQLGIQVYADLSVDLTHTGIFHFPGQVRMCVQPVDTKATTTEPAATPTPTPTVAS